MRRFFGGGLTVSSPVSLPKHALLNGKIVAYGDAKIHVMSTSMKFGSVIFEGMRAYLAHDGSALFGFRLVEHFDRLVNSCRMARISCPVESSEQMCSEIGELLAEEQAQTGTYIRLQVYVDDMNGRMSAREPVSYCLGVFPAADYFAQQTQRVMVSSWRRIPDSAMPARIKIAANYHNSRLALLEAHAAGKDNAILLTELGTVAEGPGYNVFLVQDGRLVTPARTDAILEGVTRDSISHLALARGIDVIERPVDRSELYVADEIFFCGTAAEVTPIVSVDDIPIGRGDSGPVTRLLQGAYLRAATGQDEGTSQWLTRFALANAVPTSRG